MDSGGFGEAPKGADGLSQVCEFSIGFLIKRGGTQATLTTLAD